MNLYPFAMTPFRPNVKYMVLVTSPWILLYLTSVSCVFLINPFFIVPSLLLLMAFFYHFLLLAAELYVITPDMIMVSTGLANKKVKWFEPLKIKKIKLHQNRLMKLFNITNIRITSDMETNMLLTFKGADVNTFIEVLRLNIDLLEARNTYTELLIKVVELTKAFTKENGN